MILHDFKKVFKFSPTQHIVRDIMMCKTYLYNTFENHK